MIGLRRTRCGVVAIAVFAAMAIGVTLSSTGDASAQTPPAFTPSDETPEDFPEGTGREETFYACTACHNFKLIAAQGMNRRQWDESLNWMTQRHGMLPLEGDDRKVVLDYLESTFPPREPSRGGTWQNPFLTR